VSRTEQWWSYHRILPLLLCNKDQFFISDAVLCNCVLVTGTSQTNTCDWLVKNMTGGCLEVDLENVTGDDLAHIRLAVEDWSSYGGVHWCRAWYLVSFLPLTEPVSWSARVCMCVCPSVCKITHERNDQCRPNVVGMGKGLPSRNGSILVLIWFQMWSYDHFSTFIGIARNLKHLNLVRRFTPAGIPIEYILALSES